MNAMLDFVLEQLEPDDQVELDRTAAEPFTWKPNTLYGYLLPAIVHEPFESGPSVLERFTARFVYVVDAGGEESHRERSRDVSDTLDGKRSTYLDTFRELQSAPPYWDFASAREAPPPATLQTRAVSLQLSGYRIVSS